MIKKNVLIISATSKNNLKLAEKIHLIIDKNLVNSEVLNLEKHCLPIFTEEFFNKNKATYLEKVEFITDKFVSADGIIVCAPEYNGSIAPIITNTIAWISCSTDYWQDAFKNKTVLLATSSGGAGEKFISSMKIQLEHLGCVVVPDSISANKSHPLKTRLAKEILTNFINSC